MKDRIEYSEDRARGARPHIQQAMTELRLGVGAECSRCRRHSATHLVDAYSAPRAVCPSCFATWRDMSSLERRQARQAFSRAR